MPDNHHMHGSPAHVEKFLSGVDYPVDKDTLLDHAKSQGADEDTLSMLDRLPEKEYHGPIEVTQAMSDEE